MRQVDCARSICKLDTPCSITLYVCEDVVLDGVYSHIFNTNRGFSSAQYLVPARCADADFLSVLSSSCTTFSPRRAAAGTNYLH